MISDETELTHFGSQHQLIDDRQFCNHPKPGQTDVSLFLGRIDVDTACSLIMRPGRNGEAGEGVRCTTAGKLRAAGFTVEATPSKKNRLHVSVTMDTGPTWTDHDAKKFEEVRRVFRCTRVEGVTMSDQMHLDIDERPWLGSSDATPGEVFDRYNMPTCGLLKLDGMDYLFQCVEGVATDANVWVYAPLTHFEAAILIDAEGDEFEQHVLGILSGRPVTVALALADKVRHYQLLDSANHEHGIRWAAVEALAETIGMEKSALDGMHAPV